MENAIITKTKKRRHNNDWNNSTVTERQRERRARLNGFAKSAGFDSWSAYETAVINESNPLVVVNAKGIKHTHGMITLKWLRDVYASELLASRQARKMGPQYFAALRFGMESGFWAMQRGLM